MRLPLVLALALLFPCTNFAEEKRAPLRVSTLATNLSINAQEPKFRFSWKIKAEERAQIQTHYQILLAQKKEELAQGKNLIWDSGNIQSGQSIYVPYTGKDLDPNKEYHWKVRLGNSDVKAGPWSAIAKFSPSALSQKKPLPIEKKQLSSFWSSNKDLNKTYAEAIASQKNTLTTPPNFPPKEESWGAQLQLSARGNAFQFEQTAYYASWLNKFLSQPSPNGFFPATESKKFSTPRVGHSSAGLVIPFAIWHLTGDKSWPKQVLEPAATHLSAIQRNDPQFKGIAYGELSQDQGNRKDPTSPDFLAMCDFAICCRLMFEMAAANGHMPYVIQHKEWFNRLHQNFVNLYLNKDNSLSETSQTAQILALRSGLLPDAAKQPIANELANQLKREGLRAGIFGQAFILNVLSWSGHHEEAITLAQSFASETYEPTAVSLAAASEWMVTVLAGITHQTPGFKTSKISPFIPENGSITEVKAHHDTPYGRIAIHWKTSENELTATITIPPNTSSIVLLPGDEKTLVLEQGKPLEQTESCQIVARTNGKIQIFLQSGTFQFKIKED